MYWRVVDLLLTFEKNITKTFLNNKICHVQKTPLQAEQEKRKF